jgi:hypothetical protein
MKQPKHVTNWGRQGETPADNSAPARQRSLQHSAHATRSVRAAHHRHATTPQSPPPGNVGMTVQMKSKRIVALRTDNKAERDTAAVMRARAMQRASQMRATVAKMRAAKAATAAPTR